ncbi:MAG: hypothetical protein JSS44_03385 [Proteobacteria bacterium]|nr:hypothetical protein [Pseudomonadota bacterium]
MRRLMIALSIAGFIATPIALAQGKHHASSHASTHKASTHQAARGNHHHLAQTSHQGRHGKAERPQALASNGKSRNRHHVAAAPQGPDEEEVMQPEL